MAKANFENLPVMEYLWSDRKRHLGLPLSFTKFRLSEDRIFLETGLLNTRSEEVLLYRIRDLSVKISLGQRLCGVGTVCVISSDRSMPQLELRNIKHPREVKELIHQYVEKAKEKRRMSTMELMNDVDMDGVPDDDIEE